MPEKAVTIAAEEGRRLSLTQGHTDLEPNTHRMGKESKLLQGLQRTPWDKNGFFIYVPSPCSNT